MDNPVEPNEKILPVKSAMNIPGKGIVLGVLALMLIAAAAGGAYWWRDKTAKNFEAKQASQISSLQQQLTAEKAKNAGSSGPNKQPACSSEAPGMTTTANIEASITSGNTAALEGYMTSSVNVIIAASEGLGAKTPAQAVDAVTTFITSDNTSWDYNFPLPATTLSTYGKGFYGQYFPNNAIVGKASNSKVISFSFDCNAKISTVFMAASEDLLK